MNKLIAIVFLTLVAIGCGSPAPTAPNLPPSFYESGNLAYKVTLPNGSIKTVSKVTHCDAVTGTWSQDKSVFVVQCKVYGYTVWAGLAVELEIVR